MYQCTNLILIPLTQLLRLSQAEPKAFRQAVARSSKSAQMYFYPPEGEDPTPMYDGLRTNLPAVSLRGDGYALSDVDEESIG